MLNLPMAKARGFREPPCGSVRGSFRPRQQVCSQPHSHRGHEPFHTRRTPTALLASPRSQSDQRGSHMPSRSWWNTWRALRGTAYRLQCTCRQASYEVECVPHWQRSSQRFWQWPCGDRSTTPGSYGRQRADVRVCGCDLSADWQDVDALYNTRGMRVLRTRGALTPYLKPGGCGVFLLIPALMGKENITCYDAVSQRAGPPLSTPVFCHNAVAHLRQSALGGLS